MVISKIYGEITVIFALCQKDEKRIEKYIVCLSFFLLSFFSNIAPKLYAKFYEQYDILPLPSQPTVCTTKKMRMHKRSVN